MNIPDIDKENYFEKIGYKPHSEEQWAFHRSDARFLIPCCGRRFGKSQAAGHELSWRAFAPDSYYWIVGPTYKLAEKEFRVVFNDLLRNEFTKPLRRKIKKSYNVKQGDMRIEMPWNTIIECVSATNPDSLLGEGLDYACMSEAARHDMSTWEQYIEPALSDKLGGAIFPSTPRGYNWYQGLYKMGQNREQFPDYESWRFPSWKNTYRYPGGFDPHCKWNHVKPLCTCNAELVRIWRVASEHYWRQEYGAEFSSFEGKIYDQFDPDLHFCRIDYNPFWENALAFDFGFTDPLVCLDIMIDPMDNVYVWREYYKRYMSTWEHAQYLKVRENPNGYHYDWIAADPRGADEIATLQLVLGRTVSANASSWSAGVELVRRWVKPDPVTEKPKIFIDPIGCPELARQIEILRSKDIKEGKNSKTAGTAREGQHDYEDHAPDALRYFFVEWQMFGAGPGSLADVYSNVPTEAESFFKLHSGITLDTPIGLYD